MKTIFLVGYMCCGKTTLGRVLAQLLEVDFYDLDELIEERAEMRITDIFAQLGEQRFRQMEREALHEVAGAPAVVACGGGTPCYGDNMALMNRLGTTVWLTTTPQVIAARLALPEHKFKRPTIAPLAEDEILPHVEEAFARRSPYYAQAQLHFDATAIETAEETLTTAQQLVDQLISKNSGH
jgi:shikimate kinase